jgi:hypothetical protein
VNPHGPLHPWEGVGYCAGVTRSGLPCSNREIRGTGWCLHHVPDELLELAEEIRGARRCRYRSGCRQYAVEGTLPPRCKCHGANIGSVMYRQAAMRIIEEQIAIRYTEIMATARCQRPRSARGGK